MTEACRQTLEANRREIEILHESMLKDAGRSSRRHLDDCRDLLERAADCLSAEIDALIDQEVLDGQREWNRDVTWARRRVL